MLTIEDGSRVNGANSYASIADADAHHAARGNAAWTGDDATKEAAIVRAMAWLEALSWRGRPVVGPVGSRLGQALQWPRADVVDQNGDTVLLDEIPPQIVAALCEAALVELTTAGALTPALERGGMVASEAVEGAVSVSYFPGAPSSTTYPAIMQPLRGLIRSANVVELVRV